MLGVSIALLPWRGDAHPLVWMQEPGAAVVLSCEHQGHGEGQVLVLVLSSAHVKVEQEDGAGGDQDIDEGGTGTSTSCAALLSLFLMDIPGSRGTLLPPASIEREGGGFEMHSHK